MDGSGVKAGRARAVGTVTGTVVSIEEGTVVATVVKKDTSSSEDSKLDPWTT